MANLGYKRLVNTITTNDAGVKNLITLPVVDNRAYLVIFDVVAYRTNGADQGGWSVEAMYVRRGGVLTRQGADLGLFTRQSATYLTALTNLGTDILATIKGAAGHDVNWQGTLRYWRVG